MECVFWRLPFCAHLKDEMGRADTDNNEANEIANTISVRLVFCYRRICKSANVDFQGLSDRQPGGKMWCWEFQWKKEYLFLSVNKTPSAGQTIHYSIYGRLVDCLSAAWLYKASKGRPGYLFFVDLEQRNAMAKRPIKAIFLQCSASQHERMFVSSPTNPRLR